MTIVKNKKDTELKRSIVIDEKRMFDSSFFLSTWIRAKSNLPVPMVSIKAIEAVKIPKSEKFSGEYTLAIKIVATMVIAWAIPDPARSWEIFFINKV